MAKKPKMSVKPLAIALAIAASAAALALGQNAGRTALTRVAQDSPIASDGSAVNAELPTLTNIHAVTASNNYAAPVWCPDTARNMLAFVSPGGTYILTLQDSKPRLLSPTRAGFGFLFTNDCQSLVFENSSSEAGRTIKAIAIATGHVTTLALATDSAPQDLGNGMLGYLANGEMSTTRVAMNGPLTHAVPYAYQRDDNIFAVSGRTTSQVTNNDGKYFLPRVSPDGSKLLYQEISRGLFVYDFSSGRVSALGRGDDASWSPDSRFVVFERTKDDGHVILSSSLYVADLEGHVGQLTNESDRLDMRPTWSPDGRYVAFDANDAIYLASIR
jgi:dipeptidyl aminopeptidase/acylaminoacyl peptidase